MKLELLDLPGYAEFVDYRKEPGVIYLVRLDQPRKHFFYVGRTGQCNPVVEAVYRVVAGLFEDYKGVCSKVEVLGAQVDGMIGYDGHLLNEATTEGCPCPSDSECDYTTCRRVSDETNRFWNDLKGWQPGVE